MYKCLFKQVTSDVYDLNHVDLASYISMARKIVEEHERTLTSCNSNTDRNIHTKVGNNDE